MKKLILMLLIGSSCFADANQQWFNSYLYISACSCNLSAVRDAINKGASALATITGSDKDEYTPLMCASAAGCVDVINELSHFGNINAVSAINKKTALHLAVQANKFEAVEALLKNGADKSLKDISNKSINDYSRDNLQKAMLINRMFNNAGRNTTSSVIPNTDDDFSIDESGLNDVPGVRITPPAKSGVTTTTDSNGTLTQEWKVKPRTVTRTRNGITTSEGWSGHTEYKGRIPTN